MFEVEIKMKNLSKSFLTLCGLFTMGLTSCSDDESIYLQSENPTILIMCPSRQTDRLNMLSEMISTIDQVTSGTAPDATTLNMYTNEIALSVIRP